MINKLYRRIFCRGGHGVHSPFVFDLITKVIEDKKTYPCYSRLEDLRKTVMLDPYWSYSGDAAYSNGKYASRLCLSEREGRFLFRLSNYFKPQTIYMIGGDYCLAPSYLACGSETARCAVFEPVVGTYVKTAGYANSLGHPIKVYHEAFDQSKNLDQTADLIVWGKTYFNERYYPKQESPFNIDAFKKILPYINDKSILVISGINASPENRKPWKMVCAAPEVSVTVDLYSLGVVFFDPKLHRKTYKSFV